MKPVITLLFVSIMSLLSGCATVLNVVNEEPLQTDPTVRTWGSWVDDQTIENYANVNISKADERFKVSRVKVVSFNGTVLLIGQVPDEELKVLAEETIQKLDHVQKIYNELTIGAPTSLIEQSNDSWLTTKITTKFIQNKQVNSDRIKVNTEKGAVYLMGLVTPNQALAAVNLVKNTGGVQKIVKVFEYTN